MTRKEPIVKSLSVLLAALLSVGAANPAHVRTETVPARALPRILIDQPPATLNPRMTLDASGQRINALLFAALTRIGPSLEVLPDLATQWSSSSNFRTWTFKLNVAARDHSGRAILADDLRQCFENYRSGTPRALAIQALPEWSELRVEAGSLRFVLTRPDPSFSRNATLLRYFRQEGLAPCQEPMATSPLVLSGEYRTDRFDLSARNELKLDRRLDDGSFEPAGTLMIVRDEATRTFLMLRGEATVAQNVFSPTRTRWLKSRAPHRFELIEAPGVNVSYLAFNLRDPQLADVRVRKALAMAIPIHSIIEHKLEKMADPATSFLAPFLPEAHTPVALPEDSEASERLLDEAGFPRVGPNRRREGLRLTFKTTPVREGYETVRIIQDAWKKIGVHLKIEVVEPAVFLASVRKGAFQLSLGRWVGVADASILERTLRSKSQSNRSGYSDPEVDRLLDQILSDSTPTTRRVALRSVQDKMMQDLPYFPLWFWRNALLHDHAVGTISADQLSRSGALAPLLRFR